MNDASLQQVVDELKKLREDSNTGFKELRHEIIQLRSDTNERLDQMGRRIDATNERIDVTNRELKGLRESVAVLQLGVNEVRYDLGKVKETLSERVIWQNDTISIQTREGRAIYGVIRREEQK